MPESQPSKKQCRLTDPGKKKLEEKISRLPQGERSNTKLEARAGINREVVAKITKGIKAATFSSIDKLFTNLDLD